MFSYIITCEEHKHVLNEMVYHVMPHALEVAIFWRGNVLLQLTMSCHMHWKLLHAGSCYILEGGNVQRIVPNTCWNLPCHATCIGSCYILEGKFHMFCPSMVKSNMACHMYCSLMIQALNLHEGPKCLRELA